MADSVMDFLYQGTEENFIDEVYLQPQEEEKKPPEEFTSTTQIGPSIPTRDTGYTEVEEIAIPGQKPIQAKFNVPAKPKLEHEIEMWDTINKFETDAWSPKNMGLKSAFKSIEDAFDGGIKPGFIVIGGDSNLG